MSRAKIFSGLLKTAVRRQLQRSRQTCSEIFRVAFQDKILELVLGHDFALNLIQFDIVQVVQRADRLNKPAFRGVHGECQQRLRGHVQKPGQRTVRQAVVHLECKTSVTMEESNDGDFHEAVSFF